MVAPTGVSALRAAVSESKGFMPEGLGKTGPENEAGAPSSAITLVHPCGVRAPVLVLRASRNARSNSRRLILTEDAGRFRIGCGRWLRANRRICICRPRTALRNLCTEAESVGSWGSLSCYLSFLPEGLTFAGNFEKLVLELHSANAFFPRRSGWLYKNFCCATDLKGIIYLLTRASVFRIVGKFSFIFLVGQVFNRAGGNQHFAARIFNKRKEAK